MLVPPDMFIKHLYIFLVILIVKQKNSLANYTNFLRDISPLIKVLTISNIVKSL